MAASYDEGRISFLANEVAEAIEQASLGRAPWTLAADLFSSAFPGGFAALVSQDFIHDAVNFNEWAKADERTVTSYVEHFAYINPWAEAWTKMPSGSVVVAEKHQPARTFADTEFYNDWLLPQGDVLSAVGLKVDASPTDLIYFPVHYPSRYAAIYDDPAAEVSRRLVAPIQRAIDMAAHLRAVASGTAARAATTGRPWPSFVVDSTLKLCGANAEAEALFAEDGTMVCRNDRITFNDPALQRRMADAVTSLVVSPTSPVSTLSWGGPHEPTLFSLSCVPTSDSFSRLLIDEPRQVLVVVKRLSRPPAMRNPAALRELYGLTDAEIRLCLSLYAGRTLQEAAAELGVSYETIRTRTKAIFAKTGTNGQSGLCALLARYAA
jgi:DNA-binding CsgD family transcriptional regulator